MPPASTVNNLGVEGADRVKAAYAPATYERLVALKDAYDPHNVLRFNQEHRAQRRVSASRHATGGRWWGYRWAATAR